MISNTGTSFQFLTNGATISWPFANKIFEAQDLSITLITNPGTASEVDYAFTYIGNNQFQNLALALTATISNIDVDSGCTVTFNSAPLTGYTLDLRSNVSETQSTSIKNQTSFLPDLHEEFFDRITRELQDLRRLAYTFSVHGPDTESVPWTQLPGPAGRAGTQLGFDSNGLPILITTPATAFTQALFNAFLNAPATPTSATADSFLQIAGAAGVGAVLFPILSTEIGVVDPQYAYGNVLRFGADQTGIADSTAAIQNALLSVSNIVSPTSSAQTNAQGGEVYFPRGFYLISSTLYLNSNVHLVGEDCGPIQQTGFSTSGTAPGCAMLVYSGAPKTIAVDASGFWFVAQAGYTGSATAGGASTITIATGLIVGPTASITITAGTGIGQTRPIQSYVSGTGVATVGWPWSTQPDATSVYSIPAHTIGSRMSQLLSQSENGLETFGYGSYSQGVGIRNMAIVTAQTGQYMGVRMNVAPQCTMENVLIAGFQVGLEATGCAYGYFKNIITASSMIGYAWIQNDHATRIGCLEFGINATAAPMTVSNRPWFVDYAACEALDPNPSYWTAHYVVPEETGVFISCDGEGGDRSYAVLGGPTYETFINCHMERWNQSGAYFSNCTALWLGGDWFAKNLTPAFSGVTCNVTIDSVLPDPGMSGSVVTIGSFPSTFGGRVTVRNCIPQAGDSAPTSTSLVTWDAYTPTLKKTQATVSTVGAATISAAQLFGGQVIRGGAQSAGFTDTLDTATNIIAQMALNDQNYVGASFQCTIFNGTGFTETLAAGSGSTFLGPLTVSATIPTPSATCVGSRTLTFTITNVTTPAVSILG